MPVSIRTLPHRDQFTADSLARECSNGTVVACDFYIDGAEDGREIPGGYELGAVLNVDHHAPARRMMREITSTNLAIEQVRSFGVPENNSLIVISHTDCDSVLSSCIMAGELPPDDRFGNSAIAADHTGAQDEIADVLQSFDKKRDVYFSLRNLRKLLDGQPLDWHAQPYYAARMRKREQAHTLIETGALTMDGRLAFGVLNDHIDGEFFPAQLPDAALILIMTPREEPGRWNAKMRLGQRAPAGASLYDLNVKQFDPAFGGRWNAGSNTRSGGTAIDPQKYATLVAESMRRAWSV